MIDLNEQEIATISGGDSVTLPGYPSSPEPRNPLEDPTRPGHYYNR